MVSLALDPGHHIEVLFVSKLVEKLNQWKAEEVWEIGVIGSQASTNPFYHILRGHDESCHYWCRDRGIYCSLLFI